MQYLNSKDFDRAKECFSALGEYKDSATLMQTCIFEIGKAQINDGNYKSGIETLNSLSEFTETPETIELLQEAKWHILFDFIQSNGHKNDDGDIVYTIADSKNKDWSITISMDSPDKLSILYYYDKTQSGVRIIHVITMLMYRGESNGRYGDVYSIGIQSAYSIEAANGNVNWESFTDHTKLQHESYSSETKDRYGKITKSTDVSKANLVRADSTVTWLYKGLQAFSDTVLPKLDVSITLSDFGVKKISD